MIDDFAKHYLHDDLKWIRGVVLSKLDGLSEYDVRRPLTATGTNLLGLVKHLSVSEARYFSQVFDRPSPWALPPWDSDAARSEDDMWGAAHETREEISIATGLPATSATPRSRRSQSTRPAMCRGGRGLR
nr:DUF664 domain-containing protein [Kribbella turkmenica]